MVLLPGYSQGVMAREVMTYVHHDAQGNTVLSTNAQGEELWRERFHPFGQPMVQSEASKQQRQMFHGKPYDRDTGLSYFGARDYDPVVGRFMGMDPVAPDPTNIHSFNRYAYGNNNPLKYTDPDGRWVQLIAIGLAALGVGFTAYDGYQTYQREGGAAAAKSVTGDVAIGALTGGAGKLAVKGYQAYKAYKAAKTTEKVAENLIKSEIKTLKQAEELRDAAANELKRKHAAYAGGYKDGKVVSGCSSNPIGCAEDDIARQLGSDAKMTGAKGWRERKKVMEYKDIPVCVRCQSKYKQSQFPPGTKFDPGGAWSK
jgi:RHS repeat-associated protein